MKSYLKEEGFAVRALSKMSAAQSTWSSYRLEVKASDASQLLQGNFWPEGVRVRRFRRPREKADAAPQIIITQTTLTVNEDGTSPAWFFPDNMDIIPMHVCWQSEPRSNPMSLPMTTVKKLSWNRATKINLRNYQRALSRLLSLIHAPLAFQYDQDPQTIEQLLYEYHDNIASEIDGIIILPPVRRKEKKITK
ncbi:hypothetical protein CAPTEDRAFT_189255 [Capitella teleta]|uniref:Uncharacterized protein n=1 Tax=Capitella teleta TaxID=283909 RepID=R7UKA6_CAPTE|nr:hypothetical protein CAPTEDRAFT_189255 [Capitella teleta]|eukprot:ELU06620.1 hypothetical protein CAPTEDRAFT_189255 [Capitella teleta]